MKFFRKDNIRRLSDGSTYILTYLPLLGIKYRLWKFFAT